MKWLVAGVTAIVVVSVGLLGAKPQVASAQYCGPMDVVFLIDDTGSMGGAIGNVQSEAASLIADIDAASGSDFQLGLLTFKDYVVVVDDLAAGAGTVEADILALVAGAGAGSPEASDEALNTVINGLDAADRNPSEQTGDFNGTWRAGAVKIAILITDAEPGGFDDIYTIGVDDVNAHSRAVEADAANILISAVFVPTFGDYAGQAAIMQDYATTTGGIYTETAQNGVSTASAIAAIIDQCGGSGAAIGGTTELHVDGPDAPASAADASGASAFPYAALAGVVAAAVTLAAGGWYARRRWQR